MGNVLKQEKQEQIRAFGRLGWSQRRIQKVTGVRRETVSRYLKEAGITARGPRKRHLGPDSKAASVVPINLERQPSKPKPSNVSLCEPYREAIEAALSLGRNATSIWQDLVTLHGFEASYDCVKRFVRKLRAQPSKQAHPTITTGPGEEAQVDYGTGPMVRDPVTMKYRRTRLFALTLGCSRKAIWLLCFKSSSQKWCELHEEAFRRLGGTTRIVVLDNLKEGVIKPDVFDPELNPLYKDMLSHYGVTALPARVRHPDRKGKVERSVCYAQDTAFKGKRYETLEEAQADLDAWAKRWADTRIHGTTKRKVSEHFAEEKPSLGRLPNEPFRYYRFATRTVHLDGCIEVEAAYYGAPPHWIGKQVHVQWDQLWVRIIDPKTGELLRENRKRSRGYRSVHPDDKSPRTPPTTVNLLARAQRAGVSIGALCAQIHAQKREAGLRQILGVLSLAKKHGAQVIEAACQTALEVGAPSYRFVRRWMEKNPPVPVTLRQVDPLIRELTLYRDLINNQMEETQS